MLLVLVAFAALTALDALVTLSSMSSPVAHWSQVLSLVEHSGELAFGFAACFAPLRTLGMFVSALCALCLAALAVFAPRGESLALPIAALVGALQVCVWAILVRELRPLPRSLRNPVFLLSGLLAALVYLLTHALFSNHSRLGTLVPLPGIGVALALLVLLACVPRGAPETAHPPPAALPWRAIFTLLALALLAKLASAAISEARLSARLLSKGRQVAEAAGSLWLEHSAVLLGQGALLAAAAWLAFAPSPTRTRSLAGWGFLVGGALVPCVLIADGVLSLAGSFGSGIVAAATPLLPLTAALVTPQRFVAIMLAGWFSSSFLVSTFTGGLSPLAADHGGQILLVIGACVVLVASAAGLLLAVNGAVDGNGSHKGSPG